MSRLGRDESLSVRVYLILHRATNTIITGTTRNSLRSHRRLRRLCCSPSSCTFKPKSTTSRTVLSLSPVTFSTLAFSYPNVPAPSIHARSILSSDTQVDVPGTSNEETIKPSSAPAVLTRSIPPSLRRGSGQGRRARAQSHPRRTTRARDQLLISQR
jgi:hypothetical protein